MKFSIRLLYLYLFSFIGLLITIIGGVRLVQLGIKVYVFGGADQYANYTNPIMSPDGKEVSPTAAEIERQNKINETESKRQRQREVAEAAAMIIIGAPLYMYHWKTIQKEGGLKKKRG